jgi:hypothetical protein
MKFIATFAACQWMSVDIHGVLCDAILFQEKGRKLSQAGGITDGPIMTYPNACRNALVRSCSQSFHQDSNTIAAIAGECFECFEGFEGFYSDAEVPGGPLQLIPACTRNIGGWSRLVKTLNNVTSQSHYS